MVKRFAISSAIVLIACCALAPLLAFAQTPGSPPPATSTSLIVKLVTGLSLEEQAAVIARNGGVETSSIRALRLHVVSVATAEPTDTLARYKADPQAVRVEENKLRTSEAVPADAHYSSQWALPKIGWEEVYGTVTPVGTATIAILDTGIDATHPELAGKLIPGASILDGSAGTTDPSGHGTWVAGIVAAKTGGTEGIAGVAFDGVKLMPVTVVGDVGNARARGPGLVRGELVWGAASMALPRSAAHRRRRTSPQRAPRCALSRGGPYLSGNFSTRRRVRPEIYRND